LILIFIFLKILVNQSQNKILIEHHRKYAKMLKKCVRNSKKNNFIRQMSTSTNKTKTMRNIIKETTNKKENCRPGKNHKLNINNVIVESPNIVANSFNNYFLTVGESACQQEQPRGRPPIHPPPNSMYLNPVTECEVSRII
jgi:hypothetical protein